MASSCQGSFPTVTKLLKNFKSSSKSRSRSILWFKDRLVSDYAFRIIEFDFESMQSTSRRFSSLSCAHPLRAVSVYQSHCAGDIHSLARPSNITGLPTFQQWRHISGGPPKSSQTRYYDVLGVTPSATQHQIKAAYYNMSKLYHPDVSKGAKSHTMFTEITEAYEVLGNLRKRRMYDRGIYTRNSTMHSADDDTDMYYTAAYRQRAQGSPFERGDRPPPPRGRTNVYNFDEFYRQHYNDIRERRANEYKEFMQHQEHMRGSGRGSSEDVYYKRQNSQSLFMVVMALIAFATLAMSLENYDKDFIGSNRTGSSHPNYYGVRDPLRKIPVASSDGKDQGSS